MSRRSGVQCIQSETSHENAATADRLTRARAALVAPRRGILAVPVVLIDASVAFLAAERCRDPTPIIAG